MAASIKFGRCMALGKIIYQNGMLLRRRCSKWSIEHNNLTIRLGSTYSGGRVTLRNVFKAHYTRALAITGAAGFLAAVTLGYSRASPNVLHADSGDKKTKPKYKVSRSIKNDGDSTGLKLTLYQYQTCPFCCKLRAYLDYFGFSYDVIEVNSVWRTQIKWSKYRKVPILVCEGQGPDGFIQMNDSSVIISLLESYLIDRTITLDQLLTYYPALESKGSRGKTVYEFPNKYFIMYGENKPSTGVDQMKEERKWRFWADDVLVHMLSPNVYRTMSEALQAFRYFSDVGDWENNFSHFERLTVIYVGATAMYFLGKLLKRKYKLDDDVRKSLFDACNEWTKAVGSKRTFMGGDQPNLADLAVYGTLSSIEGCDAFKEVLVNTKIKNWFYETKTVIQQHQGQRFLHQK